MTARLPGCIEDMWFTVAQHVHLGAAATDKNKLVTLCDHSHDKDNENGWSRCTEMVKGENGCESAEQGD
jgi:hypothetical protein